MPDNLTSIDDLKVVIDVETEKMSKGLENAAAVLQRFGSDGGIVLGNLDKMFANAGATVQSLSLRVNGALGAVSTAIGIFARYKDEAQALAEAAGVGEEFKQLGSSVSNFGEAALATLGALKTGLSGVSTEAARTAGIIQAASAGPPDAGEKRWGPADYMAQTAHAVESSAVGLRVLARHLGDASALTGDALDKAEATTRKNLDNTARDIAAYEKKWTGFWSWLATPIIAANKEMQSIFEERLATIKEWQAKEADARRWEGATVPTGVVAGDIAALERRIALLGKSAAAVAEYDAKEKILAATRKAGVPETDDVLRVIDEEAAAIGRRQQKIDDFAAAEKRAAEDKRDREPSDREAQANAARRERGAESLLGGTERDIEMLRQRAAAVQGLTVAERALQIEDELLAKARRSGIELTDEEIVKAKALARSKAEVEDVTKQVTASMNAMKAVGDTVGRSLESAFDRFFTTGKAGTKEMVDAMLRDLARLAFREAITKTLIGGVTGGLGGMLGDLLPARADGGPVVPGQAYLVGERGPEVVTFPDYGNVIPNHALRAASAGGDAAGNSVDMRLTINLEGANGDETIARIARQAAAEGAKQAVATSDANFANRNRRLTLLGN